MNWNGVELLKYQFSKAVDQTFERFLDSWTLRPDHEEGGSWTMGEQPDSHADIPVSTPF